MTDDEDNDSINNLPLSGQTTSWDAFFEECDSRFNRKAESPAKLNNEFVSRMPYQKATCFGVAPLDNARYLRLIKCNQCNRILKHVGFAHHMRRRHLCNSYEQNGTNSADEAPDFLLSPPYSFGNSLYNTCKQPSTAATSSYVSEKRDGLLLVLKRARIPSISDDNNYINVTANDVKKEIIINKSNTSEELSSTRRSSRSQGSNISRPSNEDCVALRTRNRHPETSYVELPMSTRSSKSSNPKITVSRTLKSRTSHNTGRVLRSNTPDSVIVLDDDSPVRNDEESRQSVYDKHSVEYPFALPEHSDANYSSANDDLSRSSSKRSDQMYNIANIEDEEQYVEEFTPQSSSLDYQNESSLPSSSSPEMPQLERQDIYAPMDDYGGIPDANNEMTVYPTNSTMAFPTLVFAPVYHHPDHQYHPQHAASVYNGNQMHPINIYGQNIQAPIINSHPQQPTPNSTSQNGQPTHFFYTPTTVNSETTSNLFNQQQKKRSLEVVPINRTQQPHFKRKMTVVGKGNIKTTSVNLHNQPQQTVRRRVYLPIHKKYEAERNLPPPIILTNPNSKRPNMLQQKNRNYSPVVMNYFNNRSNSSPSSANSSSTSTNSYKSVENTWLNNIRLSNEFLYYNESADDLWKSKSFRLDTRDR